MLTFSDWGLFARLVSVFVNLSPCPFQLLRQGFLSHSGPLPGLDLVFCRADPVLAIRSHDVNRYTCFSSEFLFGPLNARELLKIIECFGVFRNWAESKMNNVYNFEISVSKVWTLGHSPSAEVDYTRINIEDVVHEGGAGGGNSWGAA